LRLAAAAALCLAAGCAGPGVTRGYPGAERGSDEVGVIVTMLREQEYLVIDNQLTSVDDLRFDKAAYKVQVLPGIRRIGAQGTLRAGRVSPRVQYCSFELNVEAGCSYEPQIPAYPRSAYDQPPGTEWRLTRPMTVVAECADTSFAVQVPIDCSATR
jgi:hypothetical protein